MPALASSRSAPLHDSPLLPGISLQSPHTPEPSSPSPKAPSPFTPHAAARSLISALQPEDILVLTRSGAEHIGAGRRGRDMEPWRGRWRPARLGGVDAAKGDASLAPPGSVMDGIGAADMDGIGAAVMAESEIRGGPRAARSQVDLKRTVVVFSHGPPAGRVLCKGAKFVLPQFQSVASN